jgi:hypothetical protein
VQGIINATYFFEKCYVNKMSEFNDMKANGYSKVVKLYRLTFNWKIRVEAQDIFFGLPVNVGFRWNDYGSIYLAEKTNYDTRFIEGKACVFCYHSVVAKA